MDAQTELLSIETLALYHHPTSCVRVDQRLLSCALAANRFPASLCVRLREEGGTGRERRRIPLAYSTAQAANPSSTSCEAPSSCVPKPSHCSVAWYSQSRALAHIQEFKKEIEKKNQNSHIALRDVNFNRESKIARKLNWFFGTYRVWIERFKPSYELNLLSQFIFELISSQYWLESIRIKIGSIQ